MSNLTQSGTVQLGVRLPADTAKEVKVHCAQKGIRIKDFLHQAAVEKLAKEKAA